MWPHNSRSAKGPELPWAVMSSKGLLRVSLQLSTLKATRSESKFESTTRQASFATVRSPACGQIIGPHLNRLIDAYVEEGGELMAVGNENEKELVLSIAQDKVKQFEN